MASHIGSKTFMLIGRCMVPDINNAVKVQVKRLALDERLLMYFPSYETYYAKNVENTCNPGDVVLIQQLPQRMTKYVTHEIKKIVYPLGDVTDPITGKKAVGHEYREDMDFRNQLYGRRAPGGFDYSKAPARGSQKEKLDFTYKDVYQKYHVFEKDDDPYAV
uniref:EOG090X0GMQ n=1 Tax=Lynceus sp. MCZ IZ 141354 TaxID=1930659 RepID=A0A9N6WRN9_9CRUS|nr:EOG090X0GMQ [Lynceus sp. MCZ IZ 141354]